MGDIDFRKLYMLQDRALDVIFTDETGFYLTGGTCLHRFYFEERYSVDLDLFTNDNTMFREDSRKVFQGLKAGGINFELNVDSRDFIRIVAEDELRIDLVNDRVFRTGESVRQEQGHALERPAPLTNSACHAHGPEHP